MTQDSVLTTQPAANADVLTYRARQQQSRALQEMADEAQQDELTGFVETR
jgi:hypothetical protein